MWYIIITVFEYRYNDIEYDILCGVLCYIVCYNSWYDIDNGVNDIKWCLPKSTHRVIRSMRHIDFRLLIFQFLISRFWSTMCKLTI